MKKKMMALMQKDLNPKAKKLKKIGLFMKNKLIIIMFLFSLPAIAQDKEEKRKDEKTEKEVKSSTETSSIKIIQVPPALGNPEKIDIREQEVIEQYTYQELMKEQFVKNKSFILARILSQNKKDFIVHYYSGHGLNNALMGKYPIELNNQNKALYVKDEERPCDFNFSRPLKDPLSNLCMTNGIQYFEIDKNENEFKYLCSNYSLLMSPTAEEWRKYFYKNTNDVDLHSNLANIEIQKQNYKEAVEYLILISNQDENLLKKASADRILGDIYYGSFLGQPDYKKAFHYYSLASNQNDDIHTKASASLALAKIYFKGLGVEKNINKANEYMENLNFNNLPEFNIQEALELKDQIDSILSTSSSSLTTHKNKSDKDEKENDGPDKSFKS